MKLLPVYGGLFSKIDDEDFERLSKFKWHISKRKGGFFYVVRSERLNPKKSIKHYLHREVMRASAKQKVDHKDRDVLNNQKSNLRFCDQSQNMMNRIRPKNCKHRFRGVHRVRNRWFSCIKIKGKTFSLGGFSSEDQAAVAYDVAALKLHGEFAILNFGQNIHGIPASGSKI